MQDESLHPAFSSLILGFLEHESQSPTDKEDFPVSKFRKVKIPCNGYPCLTYNSSANEHRANLASKFSHVSEKLLIFHSIKSFLLLFLTIVQFNPNPTIIAEVNPHSAHLLSL